MSAQMLPFPQELRPQLPTIVGNMDYLSLRQRLEKIDSILHQSSVEADFVQRALAHWKVAGSREPTAREQLNFQLRSRRALRCTMLRTLLQEDYRGFSCQLAGNPLHQWFCLIDALDRVRVPSKSELHRFADWLPAGQMRKVVEGLLRGAVERPGKLRLKEALDTEEYFLDSTCVKANIHFPTDWVLLRDAVRTLMKATLLIRRAGLRGRMRPPEECLERMNRLSMDMSQQARRAGSKKGRKRVPHTCNRVCISAKHRTASFLNPRWNRGTVLYGMDAAGFNMRSSRTS